jgi:hypothetical protein
VLATATATALSLSFSLSLSLSLFLVSAFAKIARLDPGFGGHKNSKQMSQPNLGICVDALSLSLFLSPSLSLASLPTFIVHFVQKKVTAALYKPYALRGCQSESELLLVTKDRDVCFLSDALRTFQ